MMISRRALLLSLPAGLCTPALLRAEAAPVIAAASDLQFVLPLLVADFAVQTGMEVTVTFGSTGNFATQIRQGAPFALFLAADESFVTDLGKDGLTQDDGVLYGVGRIALLVPNGSPLRAEGSLDDLTAALADGRLTRFAIANPDHAPYGQRAKEALQHKGIWDSIQPALVLGENVSQAAQFATSGNTQGGIIAYSLALAPQVAVLGMADLIPQDWHSPLRQRMVLLQGAGEVAQAFYAYLQSDAARARFSAAGFALPDAA